MHWGRADPAPPRARRSAPRGRARTGDPPLASPQLRPWSTFGTLEVSAPCQLEPGECSVVTEEDCEILKIPAKNYATIKLVWRHLI